MKINFFSNASKITAGLLCTLMSLFVTTGIQAQQSGTCWFVGETIVNGVNTNDTLPVVTVGLAPGSCRALVNVPKPALNVPGCASIQTSTNGPVTPRNETGCTFAEGCNTSFGCGVITVTSVPGPPLTIPGPPATPPSPLCQPFIPAAQLVVTKSGTATFGTFYQLQISNAATGPWTNLPGLHQSGNGATEFYNLTPGVTYFPGANNFIRPTSSWGATSFGECVPSFQLRTGGQFAACMDSMMTPGAGIDTFSASAGRYYRVFRSFQTSTCQLVRAVMPIQVQDLEPPTIIGCPKRVILNLGPGECTKSWDAPPLMAMDNCPAARFTNQANSIGCQGGVNFCGYDAVNPSGWIFNLTNNTPNPVAILGFPSYYSAGCAGITSTNALFDVFIKNNVGEAWTVGLTGYNGNPATTGCNGVSPKALWNRIKIGVAADNIRALPVTAPALDTLLLGTAVPPSRDTVYNCDGTFVVNVGSALSSNLILNPGEERGIFLTGQMGTRFEPGNIGPFGSCNAGRPFGDGRMQISTGIIAGGIASNTAASIGHLGICRPFGYVGNVMYATADVMIQIRQTCGQPYGPGCFFPVGCTRLCYEAVDAAGNIARCEFEVCVNPFPNPVTALACHNLIQISLDQNCSATITPDEMLAGGPYRCFNDYTVEVRDWITNAIIDRNPNLAGSQVGVQDIGRQLRITVRDPANGNSCWGMATVEDKIAPRITCPRDTCVPCFSGTTPAFTGSATVVENCGSFSLSYSDNVTNGSCALNNDRIIRRTWTAIDPWNNRSTCVQNITVALGTLTDVIVPLNYDGLDQPMLNCNEKINPSKDVTPHYMAFPYCVDGYLLDSVRWRATGGFLPSPAGDLAGQRFPKVLGWNCLDTGRYQGHPSPWPVYYPAHPSWRANNPVCWGPDEVVMWRGTGYPGGVNCKNLGVNFTDIVISLATPGCDAGAVGCYKVLRQWTVLDWCTSALGGHNQIIKVADAVGPQILYPDTLNVNMESHSCLGRWEVSPAWLIDNCSNEIHYTVSVDDGVVLGNETSGYVVVNMPQGIQNGFIIAEDCCGNVTKKRIALNVADNTPPNAVCEARTVVSITGNQTPGNNYAKIFASSFNQGSFDNCAPHVFFKAIRMEQLRGTNNGSNTAQPDNGTNCTGVNGDDNAILDGNQIYFDDFINFCCSDVGNTITVVFRVFDRDPGAGPIAPSRMNPGGNLFNRFSDCMVQVEVQDKTVPTVVAPPNIVVSCWFWFDVDKLTDPNDKTFGKVVTDLGQRAKVVTNDLVCHKYCVRNDITGYPGFVPGAPPSNPPAWNRACDYYRTLFDTAHADRKYELTWGFDGYVLSGCGNTPTISVNDNRECGQGQITRTVVARGPNGISVTATQVIWVVDCDPFYINRADNCDANDDITWPGNCTGQATTIEGCGADISPDNPRLGRPVVENGADDLCALISIEYVDEIFTIEPDACFKILRTWTVIDWCQYDPSLHPTNGRWSYLQIIKVRDLSKPVITVNVGPCEPAVKNPNDNVCYGHISLIADATDNCSPLDWLFYDYKIDLFNDGKGQHSGYDYKVGPLTKKDFAAGKTPVFNHNPAADNANNPFDASGTYPIGIHRICWFVEDGCGNIGTVCQVFEIKDCKAPTPYCLTGVITVPMPVNGCVTVWANDLDRGSFDNCTDAKDLLFYFNGDRTATSMTICCDDFVAAGANDELFVDVQMWVEDKEGNSDYCKTVIIVQDNQDICPNTGPLKGRISGDIRTEGGAATEFAETQMYQSSNMTRQLITNFNGKYLFGELNPGNYQIKLVRSDDPLNGVTTADIVKIQRHILGIETLDSPYKLLAADVNASNSLTASDISEIRRLVLGIVNKFNKVDSWTFVPKKHQFVNPASPWNAPRDIQFNITNVSDLNEDFVSIKMGDVTNNAKAHNLQATESRNNTTLNLEIDNGKTSQGEIYKLELKASNFNNIAGLQFTLNFDASRLIFEKLESGILNMDESNFGLNRLADGKITCSWSNEHALTVGKNSTLFSLVFKANGSYDVSHLLAITSDITSAEAYDGHLNSKNISLSVRTSNGVVETGVFELYQNTPNPFSKETAISFRLPEAGQAKLSVYDLNGKVIRVYDFMGQKGLNTIQVLKNELNSSGVLYYQLDAANQTATRKLVIID
jgi:hypothetical protein